MGGGGRSSPPPLDPEKIGGGGEGITWIEKFEEEKKECRSPPLNSFRPGAASIIKTLPPCSM